MANQIAGKAKVTVGGADSVTWLGQLWLPGTFTGDEPIAALDDGSLKMLPRHEVCLVFPASSFKSAGKYKDFSKASGGGELETGWTATPTLVAPFAKNFPRSIPPQLPANVAAFHAMNAAAVAAGGSVLVKENDVLIPLGDPATADGSVAAVVAVWTGGGGAAAAATAAAAVEPLPKKTETILQQIARQWVSGATNRADMNTKHIWTTYMTAIHCTSYTLVSELEAAGSDLLPLWIPLVCLVRAFALLHRHHETFRKDTDHLSDDFGARDMTQMALARRFAGKPWDRETQWSMLRVMIGRGKTSGSPNVSTMPGILNLYVLLPLLQRFIETCSAPLNMDMVAATKAMFLSRFKELKAAFGAKCNPIDALVILSTYTSEGSAVTKAQAGGFFEFCIKNDVVYPAPLVELGIIAPSSIELAFKTDNESYLSIKGKRKVTIVKTIPLSPDKARFEAAETTFWAGVGLPTCGRYHCEFIELGNAEAAVGDMRGVDRAAAYRLTLGKETLPIETKVEGFSSAGVHHVSFGGGWTYRQPVSASVDHAPGLAPFILEYWSGSVTLKANGRTYVVIDTKGEIPRLCFKNGKVTMRYEPPPATATATATATVKEPVYTSYAAAMAAAAVESKEGK